MHIPAAAVGLVASLTIAMPAGVASAGRPAHVSCDQAYTYQLSVSQSQYFIGAGVTYESGPGGSVSAAIQDNLNVAATISATGAVDPTVLVSSAKAQLGISATATTSVASAYDYTHTISAGKVGSLRFGNWGTKVSFIEYFMGSSCDSRIVATGSAILPAPGTWGYRYSEASS